MNESKISDLTNLIEDLQINRAEVNINTKINKNMAQFKIEYLASIPKFDGSDSSELTRYLSSCEDIIRNFYDEANPDSYHNKFLTYSILNKLEGNAKVLVNISNVTGWTDLKAILTRNFADQRDEACLNRDSINLKQQNNESPVQFYERSLGLLNVICNFVDLNEKTPSDKSLKRKFYMDLCLKMYLGGLKEPLGTTIRAMRPTELTQAITYVKEELSVHQFQNQNKNTEFNFKNPGRANFRPQPNINRFYQFRPQYPNSKFNWRNQFTPRQFPNNFNYNNNPSYQFPNNFNNNNFRYNNQRFFTDRNVFGNRNPTNVWTTNRYYPPNIHTPMSISTGGNNKQQVVPRNQRMYNNEMEQYEDETQNRRSKDLPEITEVRETTGQSANFCIEPRAETSQL